MQGEDVRWSGRGRVRGRRARVQRGGEPPGIRLLRLGLWTLAAAWSSCPVPPLPQAGPGRVRSRQGRPVQGVQCPVRRQSQTTIVPRAEQAGRKVSGPKRSPPRQGGDGMQGERAIIRKRAAGGQRQPDRVPGGARGGERRGALSKVQGRWRAGGGRRAQADTAGGRKTAVWGTGHPWLVKVMEPELGFGGEGCVDSTEAPSCHAPLSASLASCSPPLPPRPLPF